MMTLDFASGTITGDGAVHGVKRLTDLAPYFEEHSAIANDDKDKIVYETYSVAEPHPPDVMLSTTVLAPGKVKDEFYMTRGHFHVRTDRGETCLTLSGSGVLLLATKDGEWKTEVMEPGSLHCIDGQWAHRAVNVGNQPLVFLVSWVSDCGHDYDSVSSQGFPVAIVADGETWRAIARDVHERDQRHTPL